MNRPRPRLAFTLIELLVVISIIALLIAILLPALANARATTIQLKCATQLKQIVTACHTYAADNKGLFPSHPSRPTPHRLRGGTYDLNRDFVVPYVGDLRNTMFFCPGPLLAARNPTVSQYVTDHVTYQYFNFPAGNAKFLVTQPDLRGVETQDNTATFWSDLALVTSGGVFMGHDAPVVATPPTGINNVRVDGSTRWLQWDLLEAAYLDTGNTFYWQAQ